MYKVYSSKHSYDCQDDDSDFYLAINYTIYTSASAKWYKHSPMGADMLSKYVKLINKKARLPSIYTNHSVRRTMCTQLLHAGVVIMLNTQLTDHKHVNCLSEYATANTKQQEAMCAILHCIRSSKQHTLPVLSCPCTCRLYVVSCTTSSSLIHLASCRAWQYWK